MNLVVEELLTYLEQKITTPDRPVQLRYLRPHLLKYLNPAGSLTVQLRDATNSVVLATSDSVTIQSLHDATGPYFHGYVRFSLNAGLLPLTNYWLRLVPSGYSFSEAAYIAWCKDFDLRKFDADYSPNLGVNSAFDFEPWELKNVRKGEL